MAEQRITTKPTVNALLDEDYIFINHDGALRQVKKDDADLASAAGLAAEATARAQFEENLTEANEEFVETVDERMNAAESIVYSAFPIGTASGSVASFNDGADNIPMKSLKVAIVPKQAGSGDPSPDNVRPITGWSTVNLSQSAFGECAPNPITGKNLFASDKMNVLVPCHIPASTAIVISSEGTTPSVFRYYDANKSEIDYWTLSKYSGGRNYRDITTLSRTTEYVQFTGATNTKFMIELGSTLTSYEPYGTTTPVPLGQTVYGGEVDVTEGVLTDTKRMLKGTDIVVTAVGTNASGNKWADIRATGLVAGSTVMCDKYKQVFGSTSASNVFVAYTAAITVVDNRFTDVATAQNLLRTENTIFVYNRQTPQTVQLTPAEVRTLLGQNNVWSDAGNVTAEYRKDPTIALANLEALILENI